MRIYKLYHNQKDVSEIDQTKILQSKNRSPLLNRKEEKMVQ
jgi:hypothetical protein